MDGNGNHKIAQSQANSVHWVPLQGDWDFSPEQIVFRGGAERFLAHGQSFPMGLALSDRTFQSGRCRIGVQFSQTSLESHFAAGLLLGFRSVDRYSVQIQLGAGKSAYAVTEFVPGFGWRPIQTAGPLSALRPNLVYQLEAEVQGQQVRAKVDGVQVLEVLLSRPLEGKQVGLIAAGEHEVAFKGFDVLTDRPRVFVGMEYGAPFDDFYREVIRPQAEKHFEVIRMDEKTGPGVIFQDMQREIEQAHVFIAEITPANLNVFYELGYAHALKKPTILLAQRGGKLPFDISSFRVVFYDDTIVGKARIEQDLARHLDAIHDSVG